MTEMLDQIPAAPTLSAADNSYYAALAVTAATVGDRSLAASALAQLRGRDLADLVHSSSWLATMHGVVEAAHLLDDAVTSAEAYKVVEPFAHLSVMMGLGEACFGSVELILGVASLTLGDVDRAVKHFRKAIDDNIALGHGQALRTSRMRYAQALTRRGRPRDMATAQDQLVAAAHDAVGMALAIPSVPEPKPKPKPEPKPEPPGLAARCTREGRQWRIELGTRTVVVDHSIGMLHLAVLLANPNVEIPALDLAAGVAAFGNLGNPDGRSGLSAQPILDRVASRQYRQRLSQLSAEIEGLAARGETERIARAHAERDWIMGELAAGTGLGGRARRVPDSAEHARLAVGKAIRRAIARINDGDPLTGEHLRRRVHTGMRCWYLPA